MREPSTEIFRVLTSAILLSLLVASSAYSQIVIKDSIDIGPKQVVHPNSAFSSPPDEVEFKITWQQNSDGIPAPVHLLVLDPSNNLWGFDPYSQTILTDGYDENQQDTVTTLIIPAPPAGQYFLYMMVDTSVAGGIDEALHIRIFVDGISYGEATYLGGSFGEIPDTPFRGGDATWDLVVQCMSGNFTLVVPQIEFVYQPSPYALDVVSYVQDNCGERQSPGNGYYIRAELLDGLQWGDLYDPATGRWCCD